MGIISLEKHNNLFWLGRYAERALTSIKSFSKYFDSSIDSDLYNYKTYCNLVGITSECYTKENFVEKYLFDASNPDSIYSNLFRAFENAVVLRDLIGSETLAYIQMALDRLGNYDKDISPLLQTQEVIDYLYAFWGTADDYVESEMSRTIMKCGRYVERVDLYIRLSYSDNEIEKELRKLNRRLMRLEGDGANSFSSTINRITEEKNYLKNKYEIISYLNKITEEY